MSDPSIAQVSQFAPEFDLATSDGRQIKLSAFKGKQPVVLFFYPKADTPGCTKEACGFRDRAADFSSANVAVLGISPDPVKDVTSFSKKFTLNFPLLADADHAISERYGVWQKKSMMGKEYMGVVRTTFVIGRDGKILHVFEKVKPEGHEQEVLTWLKEHKPA
ncbi:MAG TPA: thioredoxin-dependent thiol peroxidase [Tepidisphaeraceae bacterium]|nr:thioredoxin-dependent thiol peroxidase [Tepidisphaeraceae bacterium]